MVSAGSASAIQTRNSHLYVTAMMGPCMPLAPKTFRQSMGSNSGYRMGLLIRVVGKAHIGLNLAYQPVGYDHDFVRDSFLKNALPPSSISNMRGGHIESSIAAIHILQGISINRKMDVYLRAGAGYYVQKTSTFKADVLIAGQNSAVEIKTDSKNRLGIQGGLGIEVPLDERFHLFFECAAHFFPAQDFEIWYPETGKVESLDGTVSMIHFLTGISIAL